MASITTRNGQRCTAVPKIANFQIAANSSSTLSSSSTSTSTSTSTSASSTSSSTSESTSSTSDSSISTTSSLLLTSSSSTFTPTSISTSVSIPTDSQAPPVANPEQPDPATQISSDTSSSTSSTTSSVAIANTPPAFVLPAVGQSTDLPSSSTVQTPDQTTDTAVDQTNDPTADSTTSALPSSIGNTNTAAVGTESGVLIDTDNTPSPTASQAQSTDDAASAQLGQSGDTVITSGLDGNTASPTAAATQSTGPSSAETEINGGGLPATQQQVTGNAITTQQTIAIAAGVVGGVIVISSIAFMIWIWRKRKMQGRRSTLLTPLSPGATFRDREKDPYLIDRSSLGPTPMSEKLWAIVGMKYKNLRGKVSDIVARSNSPSPSVNLDRGNSQFGPPGGMHSRNNSNAGVIGAPPTTKGRFVDWWGRLAEDGNFNWRLRHESKDDPINNAAYAAIPRSTDNNNAPRIPSQPDFLTLLNMDDRQLEQAARGRQSIRGSQRRSVSMGNEQHFLGGLGLNFDDPFSDVNAIGNNTAKAKPVVVSAANNPFSDANAIAAPSAAAGGGLTTYVQNVRRSRGHSVNGGGISRQTSNAGTRMNSLYRESNASISTVGTRRNKFRSDPFDLDRPDLLSANSSFDATVRESSRVSRSSKAAPVPVPNTPKQAHVRTESFTSKYSSGVSGVSMTMSQWSDPGPDVGPAAARYTPDNGIARRDSETRRSGSSQGSVGKAL
ncbi:hypothetical protein F4806DRAFT_212842 [Annulohypoxylon nitens]|nr:hypothetical protein F4806DRAFT_212842 [Annulohypoxylon nitens]